MCARSRNTPQGILVRMQGVMRVPCPKSNTDLNSLPVTGDASYLTMAEDVFADMKNTGATTPCGGIVSKTMLIRSFSPLLLNDVLPSGVLPKLPNRSHLLLLPLLQRYL